MGKQVLFVNHFEKPTSLICNVYVAVDKEFNIAVVIQSILIFPSLRVKQEKKNLAN